jgi:hypothetical protein
VQRAAGTPALFVLQGILFVIAGVAGRRLVFGHPGDFVSLLGWMLVAYAAVLYPRLGPSSGHVYPAQPTFGITPCPVTLFTFGVLLLLLTLAPVRRMGIEALQRRDHNAVRACTALRQKGPIP